MQKPTKQTGSIMTTSGQHLKRFGKKTRKTKRNGNLPFKHSIRILILRPHMHFYSTNSEKLCHRRQTPQQTFELIQE